MYSRVCIYGHYDNSVESYLRVWFVAATERRAVVISVPAPLPLTVALPQTALDDELEGLRGWVIMEAE